LEDKVLQRAVTMILEPLYEQQFVDCSRSFDFLGFSFFWGRSRKGNWVVRCVFRGRKASDSRHVGPWFHTMSVRCA